MAPGDDTCRLPKYVPALSPRGFTSTRTCGTMLEAASVWPVDGNTESQLPPESVEADTDHGIWPDPLLRMSMICGGGNPPPSTAENDSPVSGTTIVCDTVVIVILTG